jgi:hypothetical protein
VIYSGPIVILQMMVGIFAKIVFVSVNNISYLIFEKGECYGS